MDKVNNWSEELDRIASILDKTGLVKTVKWGANVYTYNGKNIVSYGGFKNFFTLWFHKGVFLKDKHKVLMNAQEGKTKTLRQWRFTSINEINEKKILEYVKEAVEIEKKGLKITPTRTKTVAIPELFASALKSNKQLKSAFEKLTPGRQKEYLQYLNEAKQEATKVRRLEKITPMILVGTGLNDRFK